MNWFVGLLIVVGLVIWLSVLTNNQLKIKTEADKYKGKFSGYEDDYGQYKQIVTSMCENGIDVPIKKASLGLRMPTKDMTLNVAMPSDICDNPIFSS